MTCKMIEVLSLPEIPHGDTTYCLLPRAFDDTYYRERTDRNTGWITEEEQQELRHSVVGIAGCGGMGGLLGAILVRLGIGEVRIADTERFDTSNINRQFAAGRRTIGSSKAFETARMLRTISDDSTLVVYPQGITGSTVQSFLDGCDVVCDEIEFWALGSRLLLHRHARGLGISLFNCNTIGFGTRLFRFDPEGYTAEEAVGLTLQEAFLLQHRFEEKTATPEEVRKLMERMLAAFIPESPEYYPNDAARSTVAMTRKRLLHEHRAPIIATNPAMATGFLADHVLLHLLRKSPNPRCVTTAPPAPGYLYLDAAQMNARVVTRAEVTHALP